MEKIPHHVNLELVDFINKMLKKDAADRPCIEEIIYNSVFQTKAQLQKVSLPPILNKQKLL
jgi:serine/threonine protein kinase